MMARALLLITLFLFSASSFGETQSNSCSIAIGPSLDLINAQTHASLRTAFDALKHSFTPESRDNAHRNASIFVAETQRLKFARLDIPSNLRQKEKMWNLEESMLAKIREKLEREGDEGPVDYFRFDREMNDERHQIQWHLTVVYKNNIQHRMATIHYWVHGKKMEIVELDIDVESKFQRAGVSTVMLAKVLEDNPQTERISTAMVGDNKTAYINAIYEMGLPPEKAIQRTAAYKIRASLGYSVDYRESNFPSHPTKYSIIRFSTVRDDIRQSDLADQP